MGMAAQMPVDAWSVNGTVQTIEQKETADADVEGTLNVQIMHTGCDDLCFRCRDEGFHQERCIDNDKYRQDGRE